MGRYYPLTDAILDILEEVHSIQEEKGIHSDFIFVKENGDWITTGGYESFVRGICENCGLTVKNTHAFRMSLNSNVLVENGIDVSDRANLLGHSKSTNLKYYTHSQKGYVEKNRLLLNSLNSKKSATELPSNVVFMPCTYTVHTKKRSIF